MARLSGHDRGRHRGRRRPASSGSPSRASCAARPGASIVLEKEDEVGVHQTGQLSGVIHAGIYYAPGSLKARLCVEGARELYEFCEQHGVPFERCGKVIVALDEAELPGLDELERRGIANGVPGLRRVDGDELREIEPHAPAWRRCTPRPPGSSTSRRSRGRWPRSCATRASSSRPDARCATSRRGTGASRSRTRAATTRARFAIFCAGAWSDRLADARRAPADPRIVPFRGAYLKLRPERASLVRSLIYPVPDPALPFLGVHLTRHISGDVLVGPTALLAPRATRTPRAHPAARRGATLAWPGTWRMARRWWRTGPDRAALRAQPRRARARGGALRARAGAPTTSSPRSRACARRRSPATASSSTTSSSRAASARSTCATRPHPAATSSLAIARLMADEAERAA